ncbi:MAG: DUF4032 domain-containing protein, partial [Paeniglutamicibacter terrestris]
MIRHTANWHDEPTNHSQSGKLPRENSPATAPNIAGSLSITAATADPGLLELPWQIPLEQWPSDKLA